MKNKILFYLSIVLLAFGILGIIICIPTFNISNICLYVIWTSLSFIFYSIQKKKISKTNGIKKHNNSNITPNDDIENKKEKQEIKTYNFKIAGCSYYQDNISKLAFENDEYDSMTRKKIIDEGLYDEKIFKHEFYIINVKLIDEPTNEYDPKAIKVYFDNVHVGYIKKDSTSRVRNLIKNNYSIDGEVFGGEYKLVQYDPYENEFSDMIIGEYEYNCTISINIKE